MPQITQVTVQRMNESQPVTIDLDEGTKVATCNNPCGANSGSNLRIGYGMKRTLCTGVTLSGEPKTPERSPIPADPEHFPKCGMVFSGDEAIHNCRISSIAF